MPRQALEIPDDMHVAAVILIHIFHETGHSDVLHIYNTDKVGVLPMQDAHGSDGSYP